jgi:hypothetical protein
MPKRYFAARRSHRSRRPIQSDTWLARVHRVNDLYGSTGHGCPGPGREPPGGQARSARFDDRFPAAGSADVAPVSPGRLARARPPQRLPDRPTRPRPTLSVTHRQDHLRTRSADLRAIEGRCCCGPARAELVVLRARRGSRMPCPAGMSSAGGLVPRRCMPGSSCRLRRLGPRERDRAAQPAAERGSGGSRGRDVDVAVLSRPVKSIGRVNGWLSASSASSAPRGRTRLSLMTPQHMFPCSMNVIPPNIARSVRPAVPCRLSRTRAARSSSYGTSARCRRSGHPACAIAVRRFSAS